MRVPALNVTQAGSVDLAGSDIPFMIPQADDDGNITWMVMPRSGGGVPGGSGGSGSAQVQTGYTPPSNPKNPTAIADGAMGQLINGLSDSQINQYLDHSVDPHECCANFVSACLQASGELGPQEHSNLVTGLGSLLAATGRFHQVSLADAKPGDVLLMGSPQHAVLVQSNVGGQLTIVGSNNCGPGGIQKISTFANFGSGCVCWEYNNYQG
jgi:hypothetical protein